MFGSLVRKELATHLLELRFLICAVLCVVLAGVSVFVLRADLVTRQTDFNRNRAIYRQQAEEYGSYRTLQGQGIRVDRPPQNFQVLFYGLEKTPDRTAVISGDFLPGFQGDLNSNPMVLMFPVADLLFVVGIVLSLLAFFMSYDAVAGERESGTLKLLLSYAVPRDTIILTKLIGGYLSLALPFLVALFVSAVIISTSGEIVFTGEDWVAFFMAGGVSLLLMAVMFSIGLFVSVRARRSSTAILSLLFVWVFLALILPNAGPYLATLFAPVPDVGTVERQIALRIKGLSDEYRREWGTHGSRMRTMTPAERREFFQQLREKREVLRAATNKASEEIIRDFERKLQRQIDVARTVSRLSPMASYVYANTDIGETGVRHEHQLVRGLRVFQQQFSRYVEEKLRDHPGRGMGATEADYSIEDMPVFSHKAEDLSARMSSRTTDILLLAIFAVLFFMGTFISFLRTDIT